MTRPRCARSAPPGGGALARLAELPGDATLLLIATVLVSGADTAAAGVAAPISAAGGGALAKRCGGAKLSVAVSAVAGTRALSRSAGGRAAAGGAISRLISSTTVIRPRGRGTAGARSTA